MAKTFITDSLTGSRIPFLRGILIRSLQDCGLPFDRAFEISSQARDGLTQKTEFQSLELRELVVDLLAKAGLFDIIARYSDRSLPAEPLVVIERDGTRSGFSTSENRRFLESCGLTSEESLLVIGKLQDSLAQENRREIPAAMLVFRIYQILKNEFGPPYDHDYLVWKHFQQSGKPLLLLIGGATGSGKSTLATEIAHKLNIVRTQSTDMLREVMRIMIPQGLLPIACIVFQGLGNIAPGQEYERSAFGQPAHRRVFHAVQAACNELRGCYDPGLERTRFPDSGGRAR